MSTFFIPHHFSHFSYLLRHNIFLLQKRESHSQSGFSDCPWSFPVCYDMCIFALCFRYNGNYGSKFFTVLFPIEIGNFFLKLPFFKSSVSEKCPCFRLKWELTITFSFHYRFITEAAISLLMYLFWNWIQVVASYAFSRASFKLFPFAVTPSTRPPLVTILPCSSNFVPEWNT